ncbi:MAG: hypothetical protein HUJ26_19760 [Planctomycetaceae bacterium]|nr:hypothetical protein [Planctomycetaceae bacterium]
MQSSSLTKILCAGLGMTFGIFASQFWPSETVSGETADRNDHLTMLTVPTGTREGDVESIFTLNYQTGQLVGATLDPNTGRFTRFYRRDIKPDFGVSPQAKPLYTMSAGTVPFSRTGKIQAADGVLYISELNSGQVAAYAYPFSPSDKVLPTMPIGLLDVFAFREVNPAN